MALRKCRICGLEAHTKEELKLFVDEKRGLYGKQNRCKKCYNEQRRKRLLTDERAYLLKKFKGMKQRCYNSSNSDYLHYGGRGIIICEEWLDNPDLFIEWAIKSGWRRDLTIERRDNDGSYSPENCHWILQSLQSKNLSNKVTFPEKGTRICKGCKTEKPLTSFGIDRSKPQGRHYICRECRRV